MKNITPILCIFAAAMLLAPAPSAKTRASGNGDYSSSQPASGKVGAYNAVNTVTPIYPADLEARLRPILEERADFRRGAKGGRAAASARNPSISQSDLFAMAKVWNSLSPEFRALYAEATAIPKNFNYYVSPGGNFKVFYTTVGRDSVSGVDTVGYGLSGQPDRWRERRSGANGVPDYVDEAAFALDSAWSMEVVRFGFPKPKAAPDQNGSTAQYCVLIIKSEDYGVTYPVARSATGQAGFTSYVEVNGNWSGREWAGLGYDKRPYDALRVTCAHEFFHSIQYSMVWTIDLDNLSYGWLEGSAVLMEELAFPDINDYLQYVSSYFSNPKVSLLSDDDVYMNSILFKYLYEKAIPGGGNIGIVKAVHDNNLAQRNISFHQNITKSVLSQAGREWAATLNDFHVESYFTGARARPWAFVSDAKLMAAWKTPATAARADTSANIRAYSMGLFMYKPQPNHDDTLVLLISGQRDASASGATWGAGAIVTEGAGDSAGIVHIDINQNGVGRLEIADWNKRSSCLLVLTNAVPSTKQVTVKIAAPGDTAIPINPVDPADPPDSSIRNAKLRIFSNTVKISSRPPKTIRIAGGDILDITIVTQDGRIMDRWSATAAGGEGGNAFQKNKDGSVEWYPAKRDKRPIPGICFISASSTNPVTGKKNVLRRKIMLLP